MEAQRSLDTDKVRIRIFLYMMRIKVKWRVLPFDGLAEP